ncbi:MAG TPA: hypothetical protein VMW89_19530 [Desulfatiglandales bacterium]|nr:hypothetical protein [Desulfatiglandales bacterium]
MMNDKKTIENEKRQYKKCMGVTCPFDLFCYTITGKRRFAIIVFDSRIT